MSTEEESGKERQLLEMVALQAILGYPAALQVHDASTAAAVACLADPLADAAQQQDAVSSTATAETIKATIRLAADNGHSLDLHIALPRGYPDRDAPRIEASSSTLPRELPRECTGQVLEPLIAAAAAAAAAAAGAPEGGGGAGGAEAAEGSRSSRGEEGEEEGGTGECLYELCEAARAWLEAAAPAPPARPAQHALHAAGGGGAASGGGGCDQPSSSGRRACGQGGEEAQVVALLQLDHMRDRAGYTKTLRRWAAELRLSGGLLRTASPRLILVLLVGGDGSVREFMVRLKTQNVDVDSRGRPCKERMMTVLSQGPLPPGCAPPVVERAGSTNDGPASSIASGLAVAGFRDVELASRHGLATLLTRAGVPADVVEALNRA